MSKIKICGLSQLQDIETVNKVLPDFIGFVFAKSRRQVSFQSAKLLKNNLNPAITAVGVFVNEELETIVTLCNSHVIDMVQLHGDEGLDYILALKARITNPIIKAIRVKDMEDVKKAAGIPSDYLLFDTYQEKQFGGSGKVFDWSYLANIEKPYFLAGGIHSANILEAKRQCNPYCIDISSGVESNGFKDSGKIIDIVRKIRSVKEMVNGRFGEYGGQFIPETLMNAVIEIENAYNHYKNDEAFCKELDDLLKNYAGRPSLLYYADKMTKDLGGAKIYLKREDLNHTGSHKINNVLGQVLLAKKMGKTRVIAETGAGQHGVATATAAALMGMECEIFMGEEDTKRQALNVFRMELLGAKVHPVRSGTMTLKDAVNEALREWTTRVNDTHYVFGSVMGPHPFPTIVRDFQSVIGKEVKQELVETEGRLPDAIIACVGGGSNAMGIFYDFIEDSCVQLIGCEAAGLGIDTDKNAATIAFGTKGIFHGMNSYFCQDKYGQIAPVYSISAGLDYPGIGPEHAHLHDIGRASYVPVTDEEAVEAFEYLSQTEGIIPAIESAHAVAYAKKLAPTMSKDKILVINISGRGDKDVAAIARYRGVQIYE